MSNDRVNLAIRHIQRMTSEELVRFSEALSLDPASVMLGAARQNKSVDVRLISMGPQKIGTIKVVREVTGLPLKEAKDLVDEIQESSGARSLGISVLHQHAANIVSQFEAIGAKAKIVPAQ